MESLFSSGHAADVVLVALVIEAVVLLAFRRRLGFALADVAFLLLPGLFLVLALRAALVDAPWTTIAAALLAALVAHLGDVWRRTRQG